MVWTPFTEESGRTWSEDGQNENQSFRLFPQFGSAQELINLSNSGKISEKEIAAVMSAVIGTIAIYEIE